MMVRACGKTLPDDGKAKQKTDCHLACCDMMVIDLLCAVLTLAAKNDMVLKFKEKKGNENENEMC